MLSSIRESTADSFLLACYYNARTGSWKEESILNSLNFIPTTMRKRGRLILELFFRTNDEVIK